MERLAAAYEEALQALRISDRDDPINEVIAQRNIEGARTGVRDPHGRDESRAGCGNSSKLVRPQLIEVYGAWATAIFALIVGGRRLRLITRGFGGLCRLDEDVRECSH
jgi:hypothetical protein